MSIKLLNPPNLTKYIIVGLLFCFFLSFSVYANKENVQNIITGTITSSDDNLPIPGVNIFIKDVPNVGAVTDMDGNYSIQAPADATLVFSFIGFKTVEEKINNRTEINVVMDSDMNALQEVIVVGYGQQKKESVVGAISQVKGETLQRAGGITNLGQALSGNVPGLVVSNSTGMPGEETPNLLIRAQTTWNNSSPLVLIDGVERPLSDIDISSVKTISVLKDASATAVFGVRGANGVILVTTKRGRVGKAAINVRANTTAKTISRLPNKYDVYDALMLKNRIVEYELGSFPDEGGVWAYINPQSFINQYRNQTTQEQRERYPNIDWQDYLFKDFAMSYGANVNLQGGSEAVQYFSSLDYTHEGDLFKKFNSGKGYQPVFSYNRVNTRTNLDFQLTKSTEFSVNLFGSYGIRKSPNGIGVDQVGEYVAGAYNMPGDAFYPHYSDGSWGFYYPERSGTVTQNSARIFANGGVREHISTRFSTDFILKQDLSFLLKGLDVQGMLSWDNRFLEHERGIYENTNVLLKWIDPKTGIVYGDPDQTIDGTSQFDWVPAVNWTTSGGSIDNKSTYRGLNYNVQLNYANTFLDIHNFTAMGRFMRQEQSFGKNIPSYREDWIFRTTYNFDSKYFIEYNGAYNGSEKFGPDYRFGFFSSGAIGWMVSEEHFMDDLDFINTLKLKASYGKIGDDGGGSRFIYRDIWSYGNTSKLGVVPGAGEESPYNWYTQTQVGNPEIHWETVTKKNLGLEFSVFDNMFSGNVEIFEDLRENILLNGSRRAVPSYFGVNPPTANAGRVKGTGYEVELHYNKSFNKNLSMWVDLVVTRAKNEILYADDPELLPNYQKKQGFPNGQAESNISNGYYNTYDQLYGSTPFNTNDTKIPGNYYIVDFNADGVIDQDDVVPYGYSGTPQNTYNLTVGFEWKGLRAFTQFYGVNNVSRWVGQGSFDRPFLNNAYDIGSFWSPENMYADAPLPRLVSNINGAYLGEQFMYDGSYLRLKNAEISYSFNSDLSKQLGFSSLRVFVNGNNLWLWSNMPDDRESNLAGGVYVNKAYPTVKRYNLGINVSF